MNAIFCSAALALSLASGATMAAAAPIGTATTLNFNSAVGTITTYNESGYTLTAVSGVVTGGSYGFGGTRSLSVLGPLAAAYDPNKAPGILSLTASDGGFFTLNSFYSVLGGSSGTNTVTFDGYVNNVLVGSKSFDSTAGGFAFPTQTNWTTAFDKVLITMTTTSSSSAFDNLALTGAAGPAAAVPEPASWVMMLAGFGIVGAGMRRRSTRMIQAI